MTNLPEKISLWPQLENQAKNGGMAGSGARIHAGFAGKATVKWLAIPVVLIGLAVIGTWAMAVEEPKFTVTLHDGAFEVRDYPAVIVAEVIVSGDQKTAVRQGFGLLAGYIFGGNTRQQRIAMTAPVAQQPAGGAPTGETIAMTAPVTQIRSGDSWVVRFTMPSRYTLATLPNPANRRVTLRQVAPARYLVVRFSGVATQASLTAKTAELIAFAHKHGLQMVGPAALAQYDPPWTLWFLRRNEVQIQLAG
jgi:hypothetical protein